jgi:hypothetical protein
MPITELPPPDIDLDDQLAEITLPDIGEAVAHGARRFGYLVAAVINGAMLYIIHHLEEWGWFGFITGDFDRVVPALTVSIGVTIAAYAAFVVYDRQPFKTGMNLIIAGFNIWATMRVWDVFPFDFSHLDFNWAPVFRFVLVLAIVGTVIGAITEISRLARGTTER